MVEREQTRSGPSSPSGVRIGLHIEFEGRQASGAERPPERLCECSSIGSSTCSADEASSTGTRTSTAPELVTPVFQMAQQIGVPVRSVNPDLWQWLEGARDRYAGQPCWPPWSNEFVEPHGDPQPYARALPNG